jgi:hypothetical protein
MNIYTEVTIAPHHAGFGMYQRGEVQSGPETSCAFESDLIGRIAENSDEILSIEEAIVDAGFIAAGVEDIRGKIYNEPSKVFARLDRGDLSYFGIVENEVAEGFFGK